MERAQLLDEFIKEMETRFYLLKKRADPGIKTNTKFIDFVLYHVCNNLGVNTNDVIADDKRPHIVEARYITYYLVRKIGGRNFTYDMLANFADRSRHTVVTGIRKIQLKLEDQKSFRNLLLEIENDIANHIEKSEEEILDPIPAVENVPTELKYEATTIIKKDKDHDTGDKF
jgi:hypothetical protein